MKTGLYDCDGKMIYEGDYLVVVKKSLERRDLSNIGRVVWDSRRQSWAVIRMFLPDLHSRPCFWGQVWADWLVADNSTNYQVAIAPYTHRKLRFDKNYDGEWKPAIIYSGGVEVPFTTYKDAHNEEMQNLR